LSPRDGRPFRPQDVADVALRDGRLECGSEESGQFLLSEGWVLAFSPSQPDPTLRVRLIRVTVAVVNEGLPGRASLTVATAKLGEIVPAEGKAQFLAEDLKVFSLIEAQEESLLRQSSFDLPGRVALHGVPPEAEDSPMIPLMEQSGKILDW